MWTNSESSQFRMGGCDISPPTPMPQCWRGTLRNFISYPWYLSMQPRKFMWYPSDPESLRQRKDAHTWDVKMTTHWGNSLALQSQVNLGGQGGATTVYVHLYAISGQTRGSISKRTIKCNYSLPLVGDLRNSPYCLEQVQRITFFPNPY